MRIYLIGFMGSGKTALGKKLANIMNCPFYDLDEIFETNYKITIYDFFQKYGEEAFRKLERKLLQSSLELESAVISTGGGTPCFFDNMEFINKNGISVFLDLPINMTIHRLKNARKPRPLLASVEPSELKDFLQTLYNKRLPIYRMANIIMEEEAMDSKNLAKRVHEILKEKGLTTD